VTTLALELVTVLEPESVMVSAKEMAMALGKV